MAEAKANAHVARSLNTSLPISSPATWRQAITARRTITHYASVPSHLPRTRSHFVHCLSDIYPQTHLLQVDSSAIFSYGSTSKEIAKLLITTGCLNRHASDHRQLRRSRILILRALIFRTG